jgi:hypothetical protein
MAHQRLAGIAFARTGSPQAVLIEVGGYAGRHSSKHRA